jgi:hypothetical protein
MTASITEAIASAANALFMPYVVAVLLGTGLFLTIRLRFVQLRRFPEAVRAMLARQAPGAGGVLSPFQAFMTALGASVGTGNIAGVSTSNPGWAWPMARLSWTASVSHVTARGLMSKLSLPLNSRSLLTPPTAPATLPSSEAMAMPSLSESRLHSSDGWLTASSLKSRATTWSLSFHWLPTSIVRSGSSAVSARPLAGTSISSSSSRVSGPSGEKWSGSAP